MFKKAVRQGKKLRMALIGPSGSGKTYTALAIATGVAEGGPIAVVDTENGSASLYSDVFSFDVAEMHPPFHPKKYITAIEEAAAAGYAVIILDSLSHAWSGTGGLLDIVDETAKKSQSKNTFTAWKEGTPIQNDLVNAIVSSPIHVIATMRSKTEYVLEPGSSGKMQPVKKGVAAIQKDGMEYEMDVVIQMTLDNEGIVEKTRCSALTGALIKKPGKQLAATLTKWLSGEPSATEEQPAKPVQPVQAKQPVTQPTPEQRQPIAIESRTNDTASAIPVTEPTGQELNDEQLQITAGRIVAGMKAPTDAWQWAAEGKHTDNEHSARTRWTAIVKDQGGYKPEKFNAIATAFVAHYLAKPVAASGTHG